MFVLDCWRSITVLLALAQNHAHLTTMVVQCTNQFLPECRLDWWREVLVFSLHGMSITSMLPDAYGELFRIVSVLVLLYLEPDIAKPIWRKYLRTHIDKTTEEECWDLSLTNY